MTAMLPEYPLSREEQAAPEAASAAGSVNLPTHLTFAQEVRAERLDILWKVTAFLAFLVWWTVIVISGGRGVSLVVLVAPTLILAVSAVMTGQFLKHDRFQWAVWVYSVGWILTISLVMGYGGEFGEDYAPFAFPLLIFVVGLLVPVRDTFLLMVIICAAAFGIPSVVEATWMASRPMLFAMVLTGLATGLSAQMSGELYAIAEWALENYRRERQTSFALFESREALQKSLLRQQALTQQVQEANQQLEQARRSEEEAKNFRGQFLANMSHELRTPLNAIIGFSQTMLDFPAMYDGIDLPTQYRQDMSQILSSGKHLLNIINDILDLSRVDAGKLDLEIQPVDLAPVLRGVLSTAVGLVGDKGNRVKLLKDLPDPLPMVMGDPLRIRQVLLNLYSNASKFTDAGHIKLKVWAENKEVFFAVEDTGIGIAESDRATIFEEFRQGTAGRKKGRQGAGLGLAISQQLLRLMNGRLWFESIQGKGSTFLLALPLYVPPPPDKQARPAGTAAGAPSTTRAKTTRPVAIQPAAPTESVAEATPTVASDTSK
jgi:signal transduction histidine kinase